MPTYQYIFENLITQDYLETLPITEVTYSNGMFTSFPFEGKIAISQETLDMGVREFTRPGRTALYAVRTDEGREECVWGGIVWSRSYDTATKMLSLGAETFEAYFYARLWRRSMQYTTASHYAAARRMLHLIQNDYDDYNGVGDIGEVYGSWTGVTDGSFPVSGLSIPNGPVIPQAAAANLSITIRDAPVGIDEDDAEYLLPETDGLLGYDLKTFGEALYDLATGEKIVDSIMTPSGLASVPIDRFEYRIECSWDPITETFKRELVFGYRRLGREYGDSNRYVMFDYPGSISNLRVDESAEGSATRAWMSGVGEGSDKLAEPYVNQDLIDAGWPLLEIVEADQLVTFPSVLKARAERLGINESTPNTTLTFTVVGREYPEFKLPPENPARWDIGDWARFRVEDDFFYDRTTGKSTIVIDARIVGYKVSIPDTTVDSVTEIIELTLDEVTEISEAPGG